MYYSESTRKMLLPSMRRKVLIIGLPTTWEDSPHHVIVILKNKKVYIYIYIYICMYVRFFLFCYLSLLLKDKTIIFVFPSTMLVSTLLIWKFCKLQKKWNIYCFCLRKYCFFNSVPHLLGTWEYWVHLLF